MTYIDKTAIVDNDVSLGSNVQIWSSSKVRSGTKFGDNVIVGQGVYIGPGVTIGSNIKIQNLAQIYEPAVLHDKCFIGPGVILTNDLRPRSTNEHGILKNEDEWLKSGVIVKQGASIGAGAICIAPVTIGEYSFIGSGTIVTKDVPPHALVIGNPGEIIGWVNENGEKLFEKEDFLVDPRTDTIYKLVDQNNRLAGIVIAV